MKRQKIQFLVLLLLLVICAAGYFFIKNMDFPDDTEETTIEVEVTKVDTNKITELKYTSETGDLDFIKENDKWVEAHDKTIAMNQSSITSLLDSISNLSTEDVIDEPEELSVYGSDDSTSNITAILSDGTSVVLTIGDNLTIKDEYYVQLAGDAKVYLIKSNVITAFNKPISDFAEQSTEDTTAETVTQ